MSLKKTIILLTRKLPEKIEEKLQNKYTVLLNKNDKRYSYSELKKKVSDIDILVPCISDTIDASIIKAAKKLKLISNFGNGVDNLDLITARKIM
jgi:glyoxylate reductase